MRSTSAVARLSLRDAADALGISEVTARRWVKSGKLKAYQPGRKYLIPASAIEALLEEESKKAWASPEFQSAGPGVRGWLREQDARFALMTGAEFQELVLETEIGADDGALLDGIERLIGEITAEDLAVERALMREFRDGGELFPDAPPGPDEWAQTLARHTAVTRLQRALADEYQGLRRSLVNYSRKLYSSKQTLDFLAHPKASYPDEHRRMLDEAMTEELVSA